MADSLTLNRQDMKDPSTAHLRIYVGGLIDKPSLDELYNHFSPYGKINGIIVNRNFGFVQFDTESQAHEAIAKCDGSVFKGKTLSVRTAQTQKYQDDYMGKLTHMRSDSEMGTVHPEVAPSVAHNDNLGATEETEDMYDSYGNYIGDQSFRNDDYEERGEGTHEGRGGIRGRGRGAPRGGPRGRGIRGRGAPVGGPAGYRERSPVGGRGEWADRVGYDRYSQQLPDYPRSLPVTERNDCEIIVVSKALTEYAEYIEGRLKRLGIVVDLLFPMEDVPIGKVLGNIASRGCLYAILVMPQNQEHRSLTLTILHGLPQEHRNMPLEDALQLLSRNFQEVQRGGPSGREAVYALLGQLADGRTLTVLQYDKVIEYLQERREQQVKIELGEPLTTAPTKKTEVDLQQRILSILNDKKVITPVAEPSPPPPAPAPVPAPAQNKLLNDPTVRRALDSILQKLT